MKSYQRIPVQWSCHIVRSINSDVEHKFYLFDPALGEDLRLEAVKSLKNLFTDRCGTIVAYHASFETGVLRELAELVPDERDFLLGLCDRFWDLEDIFQQHYYHKDMAGSCSIKSVLPHFVPELKYDNLEVQNGDMAQSILLKLCRKQIADSEIKQIRENLLKYCERDSLAMLVIYSKLLELLGEPALNWKVSATN